MPWLSPCVAWQGMYPGDPHCKLAMLENRTELKEFKQKLADEGFTISSDPSVRMATVLLLVAGLLSVEWLTRKLLKLA